MATPTKESAQIFLPDTYSAKLHHIGLFVRNLDTIKDFYERYFGATAGEMYYNPKKQFASYMLDFGGGCRIEIMTRPGLSAASAGSVPYGYAHISIAVGGKEAVDQLTQRLVDDGFKLIDGPRTTGDGYYESTIHDPEGNVVEITG